MQVLKQFRMQAAKGSKQPAELLEQLLDAEAKKLEKGRKAGSISVDGQAQMENLLGILETDCDSVANEPDAMNAFSLLKMDFDSRVKQLKQNGQEKAVFLDNLFTFAEEVFPNGHELLIIVTELTANYYTAKYISEYGL